MKNKLCLGTVQLGLKYGINNALERKPNDGESFSIIDKATKSNIKYIDTASVYGDAESILGRFGINKHDVKIVSKLPIVEKSCTDDIIKYIKLSLARINVSYLDGYMLHNATDFYNKAIMKKMLQAKEFGLIKNIGVSIYETQDALAVASDNNIDYIQIPYNVFDQRLNNTDFFELTKKNKIRVFARSSFLQGLLLMDEEQIPSNLKEAVQYIKRFSEIIKEYEFNRVEAAFLFVYANDNIDNLVFGVDNVNQLEENIEIINKRDNFQECYKSLLNKFNDIDKRIVMPNLW